MKKTLLLLLLFSIFTNNGHAMNTVKKINFLDRVRNQDHNQPQRAPIRIPEAYIEDHTLTFDSSCIGCSITLLQDDIIIYSAIVEENDNMEGEVVLPDYLTGVFELQSEIGSITFVGEIEL